MLRAPDFGDAIFARLEPGIGEVEAKLRDRLRAGENLDAVLLAVGGAVRGRGGEARRRIVDENLVRQLRIEICRADRRPIIRAEALLDPGLPALRLFALHPRIADILAIDINTDERRGG